MSANESSERPPLVSVVIATNRLSPYFDEALASCAAQTHPFVETIVVVNGPVDWTEVERAAHSRILDATVMHVKHANVSVARNVGVDRARGEYVAFLDDDDRWDPERVAAQAAALDAAPEAVASYCGMRVIDESGRELINADQIAVDRLGIARRDTGIISPNLMARRSALVESGGSQPTDRVAQDLNLILSLSALGPFVFVDRPLVDYRAQVQNNTRIHHRALVEGIERIVRYHLGAARARGDRSLARAHRQSLRKNHRYAWWRAQRVILTHVLERRPVAAVGEAMWALRVAPFGLADGAWRRLMLGGARSSR